MFRLCCLNEYFYQWRVSCSCTVTLTIMNIWNDGCIKKVIQIEVYLTSVRFKISNFIFAKLKTSNTSNRDLTQAYTQLLTGAYSTSICEWPYHRYQSSISNLVFPHERCGSPCIMNGNIHCTGRGIKGLKNRNPTTRYSFFSIFY